MAMNRSQGQPGDNHSSDFKGASIPNRVGYRFTQLDPGANVYIQRDDILVIQWMTNRTGGDSINVGVRMLVPAREAGKTQPDAATKDNPLGDSPDGQIFPIFQTFSTTAVNSLQTATMQLAEGYLLSLAISDTGAVSRGITYARAFLVRGTSLTANTTLVLCGDYITGSGVIGWPFGRVTSPTEGPGQLAAIQVTNPAAGVDWTLSLPSFTRVRIVSLQATFTASAAVANRNIQLRLVDVASTLRFGNYPANLVLVANNVGIVSAAPGLNPSSLIPLDVSICLPDNLEIRNDGLTELRLESVTQNIQGADQWSNISIGVERWLEF